MNTSKKLRIANILCILAIVSGFALATASRDSQSALIPLAGVLVILGGFIGLIVIDGMQKQLDAEKQARMPERNDLAQVVSRRVAHSYRMSSRGSHVSSTDAWCLTFQTAKNGKVELVVPWNVWEKMPDGTRGNLHWKGSQFIRFTKL